MKVRAFWDIAPCSFVGVDRRFSGAYRLHHQCDNGGSTHLRHVGFRVQKLIVAEQLSILYFTKA
jgi:hypothetical protein